jgi:hypothetical protein
MPKAKTVSPLICSPALRKKVDSLPGATLENQLTFEYLCLSEDGLRL